MQQSALPVLLVYGTPPFSNNELLYLSNYPSTREAFLIFPCDSESEPSLLAQMYNPHSCRPQNEPYCRWSLGSVLTQRPLLSKTSRSEGLRIAVSALVGNIPMRHYEALQRGLPQATFMDFTLQMLQLRLVKSDEEIEFLRKGAEYCDLAITALEREACPGITEHELVAIVQGSYLGLGGRNSIHYIATTPMNNPSDLCSSTVSIDAHPRKRRRSPH